MKETEIFHNDIMEYIGVLFIFFVHIQATIGEVKNCEKETCCPGYRLNATTAQCVECEVGYMGPNCSLPCPFPFFGSGCNSSCKCSNESCHFTNGCADVTESTVRMTESQPIGVKQRSTRVIYPTTEKRDTRRPHNPENFGSVLRTSIFLVTGVVSFVLVGYLLTYSRYSKLLCAKLFSTQAAVHVLEI